MMQTPEQFYEKVKKQLTLSRIQTFLSAFLFGLCAHAFVFLNYLPNWDGLNNLYSSQNTIALGRCFLTLACGISSYYDLPWLNGLLSLCYISLTAVFVCELLQIRKTSTRILLGGLLSTFPAVTSIFAYMYTADGYFLAMLLMTLAIYLTLNRKWGFLPGMFLICFAFGCYQAFITFAMMLVVVWSLDRLIFHDTTLKELWLKWGRCLLCAGAGFVLYYVSNLILQKLQNVTPADYQGISDLGSSSESFHLTDTLLQCITDFVYFFTGSLSKLNLYSVLNLLMLLALFISVLACIIRKKLWKKPARLLFIILFALFVPFCCFAIYFITPNVSYHMLMHGGLYFVYVLFLLVYDRTDGEKPLHSVLYRWFCLILSGLLLYEFIMTANICYQKQYISVQSSMNVFDDMASAILRLEDLNDAERIAVIGTLDDNPYLNPDGEKLSAISVNLPPDMTGFTDGYLMTSAVHYSHILENYYHIKLDVVDQTDAEALASEKAIQEMPVWPCEGSVNIIDHTLIIKLSGQ